MAAIINDRTVTLETAYGDFGGSHKLYCIDKGGLAVWGIAEKGDRYMYHKPSEAEVPLSMKEQEYIFWGILTLQASMGNKKAVKVIEAINAIAPAQGKPMIRPMVTEEDLKALIYMSSVRNKYKWLETVAANTDEYLKMAGLIGGSGGGSTQSGKKVPAVIAGNKSPESAYQISVSDWTIRFDASGADADFIRTVPIEFSNDNGINFNPSPTDGWMYTKTNTSITFTNPNPQPPKALIRFNTDGTEYSSGEGSYSSKEDLFENCLQIWECVTCSGTHGGNTPPSSPPWHHQRMVWLEIQTVPVRYFAALAGTPGISGAEIGVTFNVFRHEEDFKSNYNVQLYKYDYETGKPLEGAQFVLYERFDDKGEIDTQRDGPAHIYEGGAPYASYHKDNPVIWNGFRKIGTLNTDSKGYLSKTIEHGYHYDKTFCDGHPAPVFMEVPEPEESEEDPNNPGSGGEILNQEEIEAAKAANRAAAETWLTCVADCESQASGDFEGVHFHWMMSDVDEGAIAAIASSGGDEGSTPDGGNTTEPDADTAYEKSGCYDDMQSTYDKFISLKYSYAFTEFKARDGYIRHDVHPEDVPVEIITTDASENGANAFFAGEYSSKDALNRSTVSYFLTERVSKFSEPKPETAIEEEKSKVRKIPDFLTQKAETFLQDVIDYIPFAETEEEVESEPEKESGTEEPETATEPETEQESETATELETEQESETATEPETEKESETVTEPEAEQESETATEPETEQESETATEPEAEQESETTRELETDQEEEKATEAKQPTAAISSHSLPLLKSYSFEFIDEDEEDSKAGRADRKNRNSVLRAASPSEIASPSEAVFQWLHSGFSFRNPETTLKADKSTRAGGDSLFQPAYEAGLAAGSSGVEASTGPEDHYSHCNNADGEGDAWRVYDHRTEGEFHINKKDLDLAAGEDNQYSAYGDAQGDGTLEGAVYGLFASEDIMHPDGKTGIVYKANNLAAITTTDKNGDASFLVNTEAPGHIYDYAQGAIVKTPDGWADNAPKNLYTANQTFDDYTEDGQYERAYQDNKSNNGNCWIGRPLLMGDYYVKELSRSEGYELSIGNRQNDVTNKDQDLNAQAPEAGTGYAVIMEPLFADEQTSDSGQGAGPNELFFSAKSKDTDNAKYDVVLSSLPAGTSVYRRDIGTKQIQVEVGTGTYDKVLLTNPDGTPKYIRAENDYQYPKYNADGTLMTQEVPINYVANTFRQVSVSPLDAERVQEILNRADGTMTEAENQAYLLEKFDAAKLPFVKGKAEAALRRNGKATPRSRIPGGGYDYSSIYVGVFDRGVREGDVDTYGLSGVTPGSPAAYTVYGNPVERIAVPKLKADGTALTIGDAILSVLDYYNSNPYYSYGGIDAVEDTANSFVFTIYAGVSGAPDNFMVLGSDAEHDSIIFHAVRYIPTDTAQPPRYIYAKYSNNPAYNAFGTYENYEESTSGSSVIGSATLITDAVADGTGNLKSKVTKENVYYQTGELVRDSSGNLIQAFEYKEITTIENKEIEDVKWVEIPAVRQADGTYVISADAAYTDAFGVAHTNAGTDQTIEFKAVLKEKQIILSAEDVALLGPGFIAGRPMNSASYYLYVKKARAKAYLDYLNSALVGDNTYIASVQLVYEGQEKIYQDAGTRTKSEQLYERAIRQKVKIVKDIQTTPEGAYEHNTNAESGHEDGFIEAEGGKTDAATKLPNFRFKLYLKSNLERLYRDNDGGISWLDRNGGETDVSAYKGAYPKTAPFASVQKLYTKVPHKPDSKTTGSVSNNVFDTAITANRELYSHGTGGLIAEAQNPGYTRLLETVIRTMEDGAGKTRQVEQYNYEKFFDAIQTANHDKWDRQENGSTSFKPFSFIRGLIFGTGGGEKKDPANHNNKETDNLANTSDTAKDNALRSDVVRQFAITWYLDREVEKLQEDNSTGESQPAGGSEGYQEEIYDKALSEAIKKAENYLKPFFAYDLDEIYAVEWDSETDGGSDKDITTLSADTLYQTAGNGAETSKDGYFYGVSKYLPYGAYVTVEQQPFDKDLNDFYNRHYKIDKPKELILPAVYEPGGHEAAPERFHKAYEYQSSDTPEELQRKYFLRYNEEWAENHTDDLRRYVIRARNADGDFEVYKYGLEPDKLTGTITYGGSTYSYNGFSITQEAFDPYKDIYQAENAASDYKSNQAVEAYYHYGSVSEDAGVSDNVLYQHGTATDDNNPSGMYFKDAVKTMTGALTAYDGLYAPALVPWTVTEPADAGSYAPENFSGYADGKFRNTFYTSRLRIEKLDSETGENILHDGAVFALYSASREDAANSDGRVKFYDQDTMITGSRDFLAAMGARDITPAARAALPWGVPYHGKYTGVVSAGTPVCLEKEQIILKDALGAKTGAFKAFTTTGDLRMTEAENQNQKTYGDQNVGYLTTPQPLGAGCYVLAEIKAPAGYVRSKPVAIEIYSDETAYYLDGNKDSRVVSAMYEELVIRTDNNGQEILNPDGTRPTGNKPQDKGDIARVYFNNAPIRLEVSKVKSAENKASYELNGRLEGTITELKAEYGLENLELAYNASGRYLGYGWKKGFLDSLKQKQAAGEQIKILYEDGGFTGKARLTKELETADDVNRYLPGAVMTLYDAVEVRLNGDSEDYKYDGVNVERDRYGNVKNISIRKGYAGTAIQYVLDKTAPGGINEDDYKNYTYDQQEDDKGAGTWTYKTVEREDTDILFYDLGSLDVLTEDKGILYSHDRTGRKLQVKNGDSIFALKNGTPFLEIISNDYENLKYSAKDRRFAKIPEGTKLYHLDSDKNRDSEVDPYTGMAYVIEVATGKILTWPVKISKDRYGNVIARDKIKTSRIAEINADTEDAYTIGTYDSGSNTLKKAVNPILNAHGQPVYYQRSGELYKKGQGIYDRDGDYVRYQYSDSLKGFNDNAYRIDTNDGLRNIGSDPETDADDKPLHHRQGEAYLIENTWTTGERTPNDSFQTEMTAGQVDVLKRVPAGTYIMEELKAPEGYVKTLPVGLTVNDSTKVQTARVTDNTINGYIEKLDAPADYRVKVIDRDNVLTDSMSRIEGKGGYPYANVSGAELALYQAKRVSTNDLTAHPSGYYLVKTEHTPAKWSVFDNENNKSTFTAQWTAGPEPKYLEAIPRGYYILEELSAPSGYLPGAMEIEITETEGLQHFTLPNDHTKVEIFKYMEQGSKKVPLPNKYRAELALYEAVTDANGIVMENGLPKYHADKQVDRWQTDDCTGYGDFIKQYQALYEAYGTGFTRLTWNDGTKELTAERVSSEATDKNESVRQLFKTSDGRQVFIQVTKNLLETGFYGWDYDFKFNYRELAEHAVSYDTPAGNHRIDYLPLNGSTPAGEKKGYYVLVETKTPDGFAAAEPKAVVVDAVSDIQLYALKNEPKFIHVEKVSQDGKVIKNAELAVYKEAADGSLIIDRAHLIDQWISGSEGVYTQTDADNNTIPDGFAAGDIRPHKISPLPYGTYYLTELSAPAGYAKMQPVKFTVTAESHALIKAENILKKGRVRIQKTDSEDNSRKLSGAKFEVENRVTGDKFLLVTDESGTAESKAIETGRTGADGVWEPYYFTVKEIMPPPAYQLNLNTFWFRFEDAAAIKELSYTLAVPDEPTKILISKNSFKDKAPVKGAELAVYKTKAVGGKYQAEGEPLERWITDGNSHTIKGKLSAGRVYMLKELAAPPGYHMTSPLIFTISDDGRGISAVSDTLNLISFESSARFHNAVEAVTVNGRKAVSARLELRNTDTGEVLHIPEGRDYLTAGDGLRENHLYERTEIISYSDGTEQTLSRRIFRLHFDEDGRYDTELRLPVKTLLRMEDEDGALIEEWEVDNKENSGYSHRILNPEYEDAQGIEVISANGQNGAGVQAGTAVKYEIKYQNAGSIKKNIVIKISLDKQTDYLPANSSPGGREEGNTVTFIVHGAEPGERGSIILSAALRESAAGSISHTASINGEAYRCKNPVVKEGSLTLVNSLSGTDIKQLSRQEYRYQITLTDASGEALLGYCNYTGSESGRLKSGDTVTLKGDAFITISGIAWGTNYQIKRIDLPELNYGEAAEQNTSGETGRQPSSAVFLYRKNDSSVRDVFKKGQTYHLLETICYSDGTEVITSQQAFALSEDASVSGIEMKDKPVEVCVVKTDLAGEQALAGAQLCLLSQAGELLEEWVSGREPYQIRFPLEPGETYILSEIRPPSGYGFAKEIKFTVVGDGAVHLIRMEDRKTRAEILKVSEADGSSISGARLAVQDATGKIVDSWISGEKPHIISGILNAGETYTLYEIKPPDGFYTSEGKVFTIPLDGGCVSIALENRPVKVLIEKVCAEADDRGEKKLLGGALLQIKDKMGKVVCSFVSPAESPYEITGILRSGSAYILEEIAAPEGYEKAAPVSFFVPEIIAGEGEEETVITVRMEDKKLPLPRDNEDPPDADIPVPEEEIPLGFITVGWVEKIRKTGRHIFSGDQLNPLPRAGQEGSLPVREAAAILLALGFCAYIRRKRKSR